MGPDAIAVGVVVAALLLGFFAPHGIARRRAARGSSAGARRPSASCTARSGGPSPLSRFTSTSRTCSATRSFCLVLIPPVCHALGLGTGLWLLLLAGAVGNWLTALAHGAPHLSVGASTLTFGAIGILAAQALVARWRGRPTRRRPWVVIVTSLVLLSMLGTAQGADVVAHVFGLLAGGGLGLAVGLIRPRAFGPPVEWALAGSALAFVVACWWIA